MRSGLMFSSPTPNVTRLLIIIIATYLFFAIFKNTAFGFVLYSNMVLDPSQVLYSYQVWRLVTYAFLHDLSSPFHVIFNALLLYMIGPQLEMRWGEKRFLIFILVAILLGGIFVVLSFLLGLSLAVVIGFSAATVGLIIAWGLTFSSHNIYLFGILPLTGKQLVYVTLGFEVLYSVSSNNISSAAHFGGIAAAFILTLGLYKPQRIKQLLNQIKIKRNLRK